GRLLLLHRLLLLLLLLGLGLGLFLLVGGLLGGRLVLGLGGRALLVREHDPEGDPGARGDAGGDEEDGGGGAGRLRAGDVVGRGGRADVAGAVFSRRARLGDRHEPGDGAG